MAMARSSAWEWFAPAQPAVRELTRTRGRRILMNKMRTYRLFTFVLPQSRDGGSLEKLSLPAMVCIVVLFCAAAAIAAPAQIFTRIR